MYVGFVCVMGGECGVEIGVSVNFLEILRRRRGFGFC